MGGKELNFASQWWEKISKYILNSSTTAEYRVVKAFREAKYSCSRHYYQDYDKTKEREVTRELDFITTKFFAVKEYWSH